MHKLISLLKGKKGPSGRWDEDGYAIRASCWGKAEQVSLGRCPLAKVMFQE